MNPDEAAFLTTRSEQLRSRSGFTRRDVLKMGAALSVASGIAQFAPAGSARAATLDAASPIVKPLPPEWFVNQASVTRSRTSASSSAITPLRR